MRILFIDDDREQVELAVNLIRDVLDAHIDLVGSVEQAVAALHGNAPYDLVITDIFIPLGEQPRQALGPRARRYAENLRHLGGLVLLDELDRIEPAPLILAHTACTDYALIEVLGERVTARVPKPAPPDALLRVVLEVLGLPSPR